MPLSYHPRASKGVLRAPGLPSVPVKVCCSLLVTMTRASKGVLHAKCIALFELRAS